ncbi:hypothetical protein FBU59_003971, partial [Linderina macrospora]
QSEDESSGGGKRGWEEDEDEEEEQAPKSKRGRVLEVDNSAMSLEEQERLALQLLGN